MRRSLFVLLAVVVLVLSVCPLGYAYAQPTDIQVYLGGTHLSVDMVQDGLVVMGFADVRQADGTRSPARESGLLEGDILRLIDGNPVRTRYDVQQALQRSSGRVVVLEINRAGQALTLYALPADTPEGYLLGVFLKQGVQGIGTLTYVRCDAPTYAALGHGIVDPDTGALAEPYHGRVYASTITDVIEGRQGAAGELRGSVCDGASIGTVTANTDYGVFGKAEPTMYAGLQKVYVTPRERVHEGDAVIVCTLDGDAVGYYAARITACRRQDAPRQKGMTIKVTDSRLIAKTGGIVQGMSGSPILQDGRLVGAVTHVTLDDPTEGYGVYADFMLMHG